MANLPLTKRQRQILDFIAEYSQEHDISPTLEEIAQHQGVNKVTIFGHVAELERKGAIERAAKGISRGLRIVEDEDPSSTSKASTSRGTTLPILGNIAAGSPIEAIEQDEVLDLNDLIPPGREVYALRVQGQSMIEDAIADGDIVLIESRNTARNGETVVAALPDGDVTLKRFYKEDGRIRLQPANSTMEPMYFDDIQIRGVVVGVVRQF
tara:strand:+ start:2072 stop:2701 length:630 start_codon:yes stop_codon:yes gene_type:complete